jgi:hypothetical protein
MNGAMGRAIALESVNEFMRYKITECDLYDESDGEIHHWFIIEDSTQCDREVCRCIDITDAMLIQLALNGF